MTYPATLIRESSIARRLTDWLLRHPRRTYVLIALCVAVPLGAFVFVMHRRLLYHAEQIAMEQNRQVTVLASVLVQDRLEQATVFLQSLATRPSLIPLLAQRQDSAIAKQLDGAYSLHQRFRFLAVVGIDGKNVAMHPYFPELQGKEFRFRDWYQGVMRTQHAYISRPYQSMLNDREVVVAVAVPIRDHSGQMVAIMLGVVPLDAVRSWIDQLPSSISTNVVVVASDGQLIASSNPDLLHSASVSELEPVRQALAGEEGNGRFLVGSEEFLVSYAPIAKQGWGVLTMVPYRVISGGVGAFTWSSVALLGAIMTCTLTATLVIMWLLRQLHVSEGNAEMSHRTVLGILDSALQVAIIAVDEKGTITMFNRGAERMLGYSADELVGKQTPQVIHLREEMERKAATLSRELGEEVQGFDVFTVEARKGLLTASEWTYVRKDGSTLSVELSVTSRTDPQGKIIGYMGIATDITERKLHLDKIERQNAELAARNRDIEHATRMKSQFLASMSHDLRTPLNSILGFSELLAEQSIGTLNEKQGRFIDHIRNSGRHLLDLINDVLDLSKIEAGQLQLARAPVGLRSALEQVQAVVQPQLIVKRLRFEAQSPDVAVLADPTRLRQILINLLSNAVKFTPDGGQIRIEADVTGPNVAISVIDSGIGIAPEHQQSIFEEFHQVGTSTKGITEGTGLGLAIVKRLVLQHGGNVTLKSAPGEGSCFTFTMPLAAEPLGVAIRQTASSEEKPLILVVDDEPIAQELLVRYLAGDGYRTAVAGSAREALQHVRAHPPDAITLDIMMSGTSGWEILHVLKSDPSTSHIPVIVVSIVDERQMGVLLGADEYFVKPVDRGALLRALQRVLGSDASKNRSCLVVDDDPLARTLMLEVVRSLGCRPVEAESGEQAVKLLQRDSPDAVILDLIMPGMHGIEVLEWMRSIPRLSRVPVIILTAKEISAADSRAVQQHAQALLRKTPDWQRQLSVSLRKVFRGTALAHSGGAE